MARTGKTTLGQDDVRTLGQDDVRTLGRPGDVSIKSRHGQVMDKKKLESARVGILDLDKRLARLEDAGSGRFGSVPKDERNVERNVERKDQGNEDKKDEISAKFAGGEETSREKPGKPGSDFGSDSGTGNGSGTDSGTGNGSGTDFDIGFGSEDDHGTGENGAELSELEKKDLSGAEKKGLSGTVDIKSVKAAIGVSDEGAVESTSTTDMISKGLSDETSDDSIDPDGLDELDQSDELNQLNQLDQLKGIAALSDRTSNDPGGSDGISNDSNDSSDSDGTSDDSNDPGDSHETSDDSSGSDGSEEIDVLLKGLSAKQEEGESGDSEKSDVESVSVPEPVSVSAPAPEPESAPAPAQAPASVPESRDETDSGTSDDIPADLDDIERMTHSSSGISGDIPQDIPIRELGQENAGQAESGDGKPGSDEVTGEDTDTNTDADADADEIADVDGITDKDSGETARFGGQDDSEDESNDIFDALMNSGSPAISGNVESGSDGSIADLSAISEDAESGSNESDSDGSIADLPAISGNVESSSDGSIADLSAISEDAEPGSDESDSDGTIADLPEISGNVESGSDGSIADLSAISEGAEPGSDGSIADLSAIPEDAESGSDGTIADLSEISEDSDPDSDESIADLSAIPKDAESGSDRSIADLPAISEDAESGSDVSIADLSAISEDAESGSDVSIADLSAIPKDAESGSDRSIADLPAISEDAESGSDESDSDGTIADLPAISGNVESGSDGSIADLSAISEDAESGSDESDSDGTIADLPEISGNVESGSDGSIADLSAISEGAEPGSDVSIADLSAIPKDAESGSDRSIADLPAISEDAESGSDESDSDGTIADLPEISEDSDSDPDSDSDESIADLLDISGNAESEPGKTEAEKSVFPNDKKSATGTLDTEQEILDTEQDPVPEFAKQDPVPEFVEDTNNDFTPENENDKNGNDEDGSNEDNEDGEGDDTVSQGENASDSDLSFFDDENEVSRESVSGMQEPTSEMREPIEFTPVSVSEASASLDENYKDSINRFLIEMREGGVLGQDQDLVESVDMTGSSIFSPFFNPVDQASGDIHDPGLPDRSEQPEQPEQDRKNEENRNDTFGNDAAHDDDHEEKIFSLDDNDSDEFDMKDNDAQPIRHSQPDRHSESGRHSVSGTFMPEATAGTGRSGSADSDPEGSMTGGRMTEGSMTGNEWQSPDDTEKGSGDISDQSEANSEDISGGTASTLPQLLMGGDDSMYAPGTEYEEEDVSSGISDGESGQDPVLGTEDRGNGSSEFADSARSSTSHEDPYGDRKQGRSSFRFGDELMGNESRDNSDVDREIDALLKKGSDIPVSSVAENDFPEDPENTDIADIADNIGEETNENEKNAGMDGKNDIVAIFGPQAARETGAAEQDQSPEFSDGQIDEDTAKIDFGADLTANDRDTGLGIDLSKPVDGDIHGIVPDDISDDIPDDVPFRGTEDMNETPVKKPRKLRALLAIAALIALVAGLGYMALFGMIPGLPFDIRTASGPEIDGQDENTGPVASVVAPVNAVAEPDNTVTEPVAPVKSASVNAVNAVNAITEPVAPVKPGLETDMAIDGTISGEVNADGMAKAENVNVSEPEPTSGTTSEPGTIRLADLANTNDQDKAETGETTAEQPGTGTGNDVSGTDTSTGNNVSGTDNQSLPPSAKTEESAESAESSGQEIVNNTSVLPDVMPSDMNSATETEPIRIAQAAAEESDRNEKTDGSTEITDTKAESSTDTENGLLAGQSGEAGLPDESGRASPTEQSGQQGADSENDLAGSAGIGNNEEKIDENPNNEAPIDPIAALSAQIRSGKTPQELRQEQEKLQEEENSSSGLIFVEEARAVEIERDVAAMGLQLDDMIEAISRMNLLLTRSLERIELMSGRVESNENALRNMAAIHEGFANLSVDMDETHIVIWDIAERLKTLEDGNPVSQDEFREVFEELDKRFSRLSKSTSALTRTLATGGNNGQSGFGLSISNEQPAENSFSRTDRSTDGNIIFTDGNANKNTGNVSVRIHPVPDDVCLGDFIEGYGEVIDIMTTHDKRRIVTMPNYSVVMSPGACRSEIE